MAAEAFPARAEVVPVFAEAVTAIAEVAAGCEIEIVNTAVIVPRKEIVITIIEMLLASIEDIGIHR